ncbi:MAG: hypothetical protein AB1393_01295 [Candidatus Edwardsbacteria bacterium]
MKRGSLIVLVALSATMLLLIGCGKKQPVGVQPAPESPQTTNPFQRSTGVLSATSDTFLIFQPKTYVRTTGAPNVYTDSLFGGTEPTYIFKIQNGDPSGNNRVSSASIYLNDVEIFTENEFNQQVATITKTIQLPKDDNQIRVRLRGAPNSFITLSVEGIFWLPIKTFPVGKEEYLSDIRTVTKNVARMLGHHSIVVPNQTLQDLMAATTTPDQKISLSSFTSAVGTADPEIAAIVNETQTIVDKYAQWNENLVIFHPKECAPLNDAAPLVLYTPLCEESEAVIVQGYNSSGDEVSVLAVSPPGEPVVILDVQQGSPQWPPSPPPPEPYWTVRVRHFILLDDHETWFGGPPEIYVKVWYTDGSAVDTWFDSGDRDVNEENVTYPEYKGWNWGWGIVISSRRNKNAHCAVDVWEEDGGLTGSDDFVGRVSYQQGYPGQYYYLYGYTNEGAKLELYQAWEQ